MLTKLQFRFITKAFILIFTSWCLLATSLASDTYSSGTFHITSDCTHLEMDITVSNAQITAPGGYNYISFGFPTNTVIGGVDNQGIYNGASRVCQRTVTPNDNQDKLMVYTCWDNSVYACTILFN